MSDVPDHPGLPAGHWWACARPEAPGVEGLAHWRGGCRRCWPSFLARASDPTSTFLLPHSDDPSRLRVAYQHTTTAEGRARLMDWFFGPGTTL